MKRQIPVPKPPKCIDCGTVNCKHTKLFRAPSFWAASLLLMGLLACICAMVYVSLSPNETDESDENGIVTIPEAPFSLPNASHVGVGAMLDRVWASTVWIGREAKPGISMYVGSGWVVGNKGGRAYIATCAHVVGSDSNMPLRVGYLGVSGQWSVIPGQLVRRLDNRPHGDLAIISVDRELPAMGFAVHQNTFTVDDEVFVAGVQFAAPPAIVATGIVESVDRIKNEFKIKGWAWFGFSGGPIILRKTGEVIGYVAWTAKGHTRDAMKSECANLTHLIGLLKACGLQDLIK